MCRYLAADGKSIAGTPQDIWRLPTVEEVVRIPEKQLAMEHSIYAPSHFFG